MGLSMSPIREDLCVDELQQFTGCSLDASTKQTPSSVTPHLPWATASKPGAACGAPPEDGMLHKPRTARPRRKYRVFPSQVSIASNPPPCVTWVAAPPARGAQFFEDLIVAQRLARHDSFPRL